MDGIKALLRSARLSGVRQLVFPDDTLMAIDLALHAILKTAGFFGQQTNDPEITAR